MFLCPVALHTALFYRFMPIFQIALILCAVYFSGLLFYISARKIKLPADSTLRYSICINIINNQTDQEDETEMEGFKMEIYSRWRLGGGGEDVNRIFVV